MHPNVIRARQRIANIQQRVRAKVLAQSAEQAGPALELVCDLLRRLLLLLNKDGNRLPQCAFIAPDNVVTMLDQLAEEQSREQADQRSPEERESRASLYDPVGGSQTLADKIKSPWPEAAKPPLPTVYDVCGRAERVLRGHPKTKELLTSNASITPGNVEWSINYLIDRVKETYGGFGEWNRNGQPAPRHPDKAGWPEASAFGAALSEVPGNDLERIAIAVDIARRRGGSVGQMLQHVPK
ncbi:MAG: hypothetical protein SH850_31030 [Planctomycetaceae bacterium]|nr:hypothetical protein [Planctomycetaceae bacterium]